MAGLLPIFSTLAPFNPSLQANARGFGRQLGVQKLKNSAFMGVLSDMVILVSADGEAK